MPNAAGVITMDEVNNKLNAYFGGGDMTVTNPNREKEFLAKFGAGTTIIG